VSDLTERVARAWNGWIDDHRHLASRTSDLSMAFEDGWDAALAAVADAPGLEEVLWNLMRHSGGLIAADWTTCVATTERYPGSLIAQRVARHRDDVDDVVRAWLRGEGT